MSWGWRSTRLAASVAERNVRENGVQRHREHGRSYVCRTPGPNQTDMTCWLPTCPPRSSPSWRSTSSDVVRSGGTLIFSGILDKQRMEVIERMAALGVQFEDGLVDADWVALVGRVG